MTAAMASLPASCCAYACRSLSLRHSVRTRLPVPSFSMFSVFSILTCGLSMGPTEPYLTNHTANAVCVAAFAKRGENARGKNEIAFRSIR